MGTESANNNQLKIVECSKCDGEYYFIWVDSNMRNFENSEYVNYLSKINAYQYYFTKIQDAMICLQKIQFSLTYFIVSGSLFPEFISNLRVIENRISTAPKIIIFTSESTKSKIQDMKEINDSFYNIGGLVLTYEEVESFLNKNYFGKELNFIRPPRKREKQTGGDFSFQIIENKNDLIVPIYLSELLIEPHKYEYISFDKYLIDNYGDIMIELIAQIYKIDCPISLRIKYWLRAYTLETKFYNDMNSYLMKGKAALYSPYIRLLYSGLKKDIINFNVSNDLYIGALINIVEIPILINHINKKKTSNIPSRLIYCKSFMSFSLDKNVALGFMNNKYPTETKIRVLYILKAELGVDHKNATNADLSGISYYIDEKEILLFPFSVYEINNIIKKEYYFEIYLNYLGKYKELFHFKNKADLYNSIIKSQFIRELELAGLEIPIRRAKKSLCKIITKNRRRGSGFFCLIPLPDKKKKIPVLITCNHVLSENDTEIGDQIVLEYGDNKEILHISFSYNTKIYTENYKLDVTIIEIEENISKKLNFMDIDEDIFNDKNFLIKNFYKKKAYLLEYAIPHESDENKEYNGYFIRKIKEDFTKDKEYRIEEGNIMIDKEDENIILHNIPTIDGASGGPILSYDKFKVIGYHRAFDSNKKKYRKLGSLLKKPIQECIKKFYP